MCYKPISPIKTILHIITKIVFFTWILAICLSQTMQWDATASSCCYIHFCRPTERGFVSPLNIVPAGTARTAAVCLVLELGRGLSVHHSSVLLPVITWSCTNSRFMQHVYSVAAFAVTHSSSFQSILVSFDRPGDVFSSLQASICIVCARLFLQPCPMDFTYERVFSICGFFSKFLSQNCKFENSDIQVKFMMNQVSQAVTGNHRGLMD